MIRPLCLLPPYHDELIWFLSHIQFINSLVFFVAAAYPPRDLPEDDVSDFVPSPEMFRRSSSYNARRRSRYHFHPDKSRVHDACYSASRRASDDEPSACSPMPDQLHEEQEVSQDALLLKVINTCSSLSLHLILAVLGCAARH